MTPEEILARLRVLFGIDPGDATHDAQLQALFNTALAGARIYTSRWLYPPARLREVFYSSADPCSRCRACPAIASEVPVISVQAAKRDGVDLDPTTIVVAPWGGIYERPAPGQLLVVAPFSVFDVSYTAGFDPLPADLAEALCQVAASAGGASVAAAGGTVGGQQVKKRTVFDVGAIEYSATGPFYSGAMTEFQNALLGPWASVIDPYRDLAKTLGGDDCVHELTRLPDPLAAPAGGTP